MITDHVPHVEDLKGTACSCLHSTLFVKLGKKVLTNDILKYFKVTASIIADCNGICFRMTSQQVTYFFFLFAFVVIGFWQ